jgi:hypothetical protein
MVFIRLPVPPLKLLEIMTEDESAPNAAKRKERCRIAGVCSSLRTKAN